MPKSLKYAIGLVVALVVVVVLMIGGYFVHDHMVVKRYDYDHYTASQYEYGRFDGPQPGQMAVEFVATDLDGTEVRLSDLAGKIVVLETGSITCSMYVGRLPDMSTLVHEFPDVVFLVLYVREAHPGNVIGQPHVKPGKLAHARQLSVVEGERRRIIVDDIAGTAHRAYGAWPNMAYVIDGSGIVRYRQKWSDPEVMRQALIRIAQGQSVDGLASRLITPSWEISKRVLSRAGFVAIVDVAFSLPAILVGNLTDSAEKPSPGAER